MKMPPRLHLLSLLIIVLLAGCADTRPYIPGYTEGVNAEENGTYEKAIGHYEKYLQDHPDGPLSVVTLYRLGVCYETAGDTDNAAVYYQKTVDADPSSIWGGYAKTALDRLKTAR